jgi:hypothetical protein
MKIETGAEIGIVDNEGTPLRIGDWIGHWSTSEKEGTRWLEGQLVWCAEVSAVIICYPDITYTDYLSEVGHDIVRKVGDSDYIYTPPDL